MMKLRTIEKGMLMALMVMSVGTAFAAMATAGTTMAAAALLSPQW